MKRITAFLLVLLVLLAGSASSAFGEKVPDPTALRVMIIPKFEIGDMSGDFPGEAQLFYERYGEGCAETKIPYVPVNSHFYMNPATGTGILVTDSGKKPRRPSP